MSRAVLKDIVERLTRHFQVWHNGADQSERTVWQALLQPSHSKQWIYNVKGTYVNANQEPYQSRVDASGRCREPLSKSAPIPRNRLSSMVMQTEALTITKSQVMSSSKCVGIHVVALIILVPSPVTVRSHTMSRSPTITTFRWRGVLDGSMAWRCWLIKIWQ